MTDNNRISFTGNQHKYSAAKRFVLLFGMVVAIGLFSNRVIAIAHADEDIPEYNIHDVADDAKVSDSAKLGDMSNGATDGEINEAFGDVLNKDGYLVFTESLANSIQRYDTLPQVWLSRTDRSKRESFRGVAQPGEFYVLQFGVYAFAEDLPSVDVQLESLGRIDANGSVGEISDAGMTCFNTSGIDFKGRPFTKDVKIGKGRLQSFWIGIEVPKDAKGTYQGDFRIVSGDKWLATIPVIITVEGEVLDDFGDTDASKMSRLRWLNSTLGLNDDVVTEPFTPIQRDGTNLTILGRTLQLNELGLPKQVLSYFNESNTKVTDQPLNVLQAPMAFVVETADHGTVRFVAEKVEFVREQKGAVQWKAVAKSDSEDAALQLAIDGLLEYDGFVQYKLHLSTSKAVEIRNVRLEAAYTPHCSQYFMGLHNTGGFRPESVDWKWDETRNQDNWWIGGINGGMKVRLKGDNFRTPLVNVYYQFGRLNMPPAWFNDGKGGIQMESRADDGADLKAYSGERTLEPSQDLAFNFDILLTPFKTLNTEQQWHDRYYHTGSSGSRPEDTDNAVANGANIMNVHQGNQANPMINYPYYDGSFPLLKSAIDRAHELDLKLKVYYTTRELTNNLPELFAIHSLEGEVIHPGEGPNQKTPYLNPNGPHPWLIEHLRENFIPAWRTTLSGRYAGMLDLSVITTPDSRWDNFYLGGLEYIAREAEIDGLYVDDTALGRKSFQRIRRVLSDMRPDSRMDLHSWNHFNQHAGHIACLNLYMESLPYFDRIWIGEGRNYNTSPDYWMVEISGIPFGIMGEMLQHGGNPWRGMVYGQTARLGWGGDPRNIWKFWDQYGIQDTRMIGYWDPDCPVKTSNPTVLATVYQASDHAIVSVASWTEEDSVNFKLDIDWDALGLNPEECTVFAPAISGFQTGALVEAFDTEIGVDAGKGWLFVIRKRNKRTKGSSIKSSGTSSCTRLY